MYHCPKASQLHWELHNRSLLYQQIKCQRSKKSQRKRRNLRRLRKLSLLRTVKRERKRKLEKRKIPNQRNQVQLKICIIFIKFAFAKYFSCGFFYVTLLTQDTSLTNEELRTVMSDRELRRNYVDLDAPD